MNLLILLTFYCALHSQAHCHCMACRTHSAYGFYHLNLYSLDVKSLVILHLCTPLSKMPCLLILLRLPAWLMQIFETALNLQCKWLLLFYWSTQTCHIKFFNFLRWIRRASILPFKSTKLIPEVIQNSSFLLWLNSFSLLKYEKSWYLILYLESAHNHHKIKREKGQCWLFQCWFKKQTS